MSKLIPQYSMVEAMQTAIALGMRALHEIRTLARMPGPAGKDGKDGLNASDFRLDVREGGVFLVYPGGEARLPIPIYCGLYTEGRTYGPGDYVTWGGQLYIAQRQTSAKPLTPAANNDWLLAVKKGRDGQDGELKAPRPNGPVKVG